MKKFLLTMCMLLVASVGLGQSDCDAPYCGSIPLLGITDSDEWRTDLFLRIDADGDFWIRLRTAPHQLEPYVENMGSGVYLVGVYDLLERAWPDIEDYEGAIILDYGSWDPIHAVETFPLARTIDPFCGKAVRLPVFLLEPGCHIIPRPWHNFNLEPAFQFYNPSETKWTTVTIQGGDFEIALPSPIGEEELLEPGGDITDAFIEVCLGERPPGSLAGFDAGLSLWFIPRFAQFDDFVVSTVW